MPMLKHHKSVDIQKWKSFSTGQQILMIANELNRAGNWISKATSPDEVKLCYERALELLLLTKTAARGTSRLRELARFQEVLASLYLQDSPELEKNLQAKKVLIALSGESFSLLNPR
jgi:hypothetical protein